jgi:hypothetical protein
MSRQSDPTAQLATLLQALPTPAPSDEFLAGARRRYLEAMEARDRRAVFTGLAAALVSLVVIITFLATTVEPTTLVAGLAEAVADLARWATGLGVVIALVPLSIWTSATLGSAAAVLSLILLARGRSLAPVK